MIVKEDPLARAFPATMVPKRTETVPLLSFYGTQRLRKQRKGMGRIAYQRAYEARPFADEDRYFPGFEPCVEHYKDASVRDWTKEERLEWETFGGVDLSSDQRPGNVIFVISVMPNGKIIDRLIWRGAWSSPETTRRIQMAEEKFAPRVWAVENNGYQRSLQEWAMAFGEKGMDRGDGIYIPLTFASKIRAFTTGGRNKADPETGLRGMDIFFENLAWIIPGGDMPKARHPEGCACPGCIRIAEVSLYPHHPTTDTVMAQWFAWETALRFSNYLGLGPEDEEEQIDETDDEEVDLSPDDEVFS